MPFNITDFTAELNQGGIARGDFFEVVFTALPPIWRFARTCFSLGILFIAPTGSPFIKSILLSPLETPFINFWIKVDMNAF